MRCGYPASSIRERIYADTQAERFGILLYTGSPDAEGTLGGLVQEARHIEESPPAWPCGWERSAPTIRSAPSTPRARAWRSAGCTAPLATVARWSPRPRARCGTTTSIGRSSCRCSASLDAAFFGATSHDRGACTTCRHISASGLPAPWRIRTCSRAPYSACCRCGRFIGNQHRRRRGISLIPCSSWTDLGISRTSCRRLDSAPVEDGDLLAVPRPDLVWSGPGRCLACTPATRGASTRNCSAPRSGPSGRAPTPSSTGPGLFEVLAPPHGREGPGSQRHAAAEHPAQEGRHDRGGPSSCGRFADRFWSDGLAGVISGQASTTTRARSRLDGPAGRAACEGRRRRRRGGVRDLGEPHRGRPRSKHRAWAPGPRPRAGGQRCNSLSALLIERGAASAAAGRMRRAGDRGDNSQWGFRSDCPDRNGERSDLDVFFAGL
jgi:hypothetical protein